MDLVNLLAFFQIAVVFDFGLLLLSNSHGFRGLHKAIQEELDDHCRSTVNEAETLCHSTKDTRRIPVRQSRAVLMDSLSKLNLHLSPDYPQWGKYAYLGLYAGMYGLMFLFLIGTADKETELHYSLFLLITGSITLLSESYSMIQTNKSEEKGLSYLTILSRFAFLLCLCAAVLLIPLDVIQIDNENGLCWAVIIVAATVVYMPMLVFVCRITDHMRQVLNLSRLCARHLDNLKQQMKK